MSRDINSLCNVHGQTVNKFYLYHMHCLIYNAIYRPVCIHVSVSIKDDIDIVAEN